MKTSQRLRKAVFTLVELQRPLGYKKLGWMKVQNGGRRNRLERGQIENRKWGDKIKGEGEGEGEGVSCH